LFEEAITVSLSFNCFLCGKYVSYLTFNDIMDEQRNVEIEIF